MARKKKEVQEESQVKTFNGWVFDEQFTNHNYNELVDLRKHFIQDPCKTCNPEAKQKAARLDELEKEYQLWKRRNRS